MDRILNSLEYDTLDYKWLSRDILNKSGWTLDQIKQVSDTETPSQPKPSGTEIPPESFMLLKMATSSFKYYFTHMKNIQADPSLRAVTELCSSTLAALDVEVTDEQVFHLSNVFNQIIKSGRKLLKCYDCGTNARAIFLKLIQTHRSSKSISYDEQKRMIREYRVNYDDPVKTINSCKVHIKQAQQDTVYIMSVSVQDFGHVWVLEKRMISGRFRVRHYQSSLRSHLVIDFIEAMDYGADPLKSLDIDYFFDNLAHLMSINNRAWTDQEHRTFASLFGFLTNDKITKPHPGFCFTWVRY